MTPRRASAPVVLDVRAPADRQAEWIEGSVGIPLNHLLERLGEVPRDRTVVVHCQGGYRSAIAASLLAEHGISTVADLVGGLSAWKASRLPIAGAASG